ncbi:MAG: NusG domain II-containing protein [Oscillospiraceae bacterium]|jgi:hypothetical protein|nr:NusG domain II-containing protein [Oscillospiraceae bacterium]
MKTRTWVMLVSSFAIICAVLSCLFFFGGESKQYAEVYTDGKRLQTIDLSEDCEYRIAYGEEYNILTVQDGKIAVTASSCATKDCVHRDYSDHGAPIVCIPNRLLISFSDGGDMDALVG